MATPGELAEMMEREMYDFYGVLKHFRNKLDQRPGDSAWVGTPAEGNDVFLNSQYNQLSLYVSFYQDAIQSVWRGCRRWADRYNGIPDTRFDDQIVNAPRSNLTKLMATTNVLNPTQYNSGFTNENFKNDGTIWEKYYDILDDFVEMCVLLWGRANWLADEWEAQGAGDRATEAVTLMEELAGGSAFARVLLADQAVLTSEWQNRGVRNNRLRRSYMKRRIAITGGLYLLNQGARPAGGPAPIEVQVDINTTADNPDLTLDPLP